MKRRTFVLASTGTLLAGASYFYLKSDRRDNISVLKNYIKSLNGLDAIGESYTKKNPSLNYLQQLEHKLVQFNKSKNIEYKISQSIKNDFNKGQLCILNGWQLSQTECLIAASYTSLIGYVRPKEIVTIQNFKNAKIENFLTIINWGPQKTLKGEVFNKQSDGHAGIWFLVESPPPNLHVVIDGKTETTLSNEKSITSGVHNLEDLELFLEDVGSHEIAIYDKIKHRKQIVGTFEVMPIPKKLIYPDGTTSKVFCPIEAWGPQVAEKNKAFNVQPNGDAAIWIKTKCAPKTTKVTINGVKISTTVQPGTVTASVPITLLNTNYNNYTIELIDTRSNELLTIGTIQINGI